ncbi:MAG: family 10 glycosylhydrolase [Planctomycetes bacterium]|nr:family 10 glycosylhydrolase [Planctomycetota bacterium]
MSGGGHLISVALCGLLISGLASAAEWREVPVSGVGFIGPDTSGNDPATAACRNLSYSGSVGFPYRNRSLVVDLGRPTLIHKIILIGNISDNGGGSPVIRRHGLAIYTSDDNRTYKRYSHEVSITMRSAEPEGGFDAVELTGLSIFARYIKLHADLPDDKWDLGNKNLQHMVKVFQDTSLLAKITALRVDRYVAGEANVRVGVELPKLHPDHWALGLSLARPGAQGEKELAAIPLKTSGTVKHVLPLADMGRGARTIRASLRDEAGRTLDRAERKIFLCKSVVELTESGGKRFAREPGQVILIRVRQSIGEKTAIVLPATGWHAVTVGLVGGDSEVNVRLGEGAAPRRCRLETWGAKRPGHILGESFVGCQNLDNTTLVIEPVKGKPARLAFVRLLGLSEDEIKLAKAARVPNEAPRVTVNNDGFSMFFSGVNSREQIEKMLDPYAGKALYSYDYGLGPCSTFTYDTKIGTIFGSNVKKLWRQGDQRAADGVRKLIAEGNDPLRVVVEHGHRLGLRIHATFRMNANYGMPMADTFNGEFWHKHPEYRLITKWGKPSPNLSYAYPEVRKFRLAIIKEAAGYDVDGIHLDFLRHPPFFGMDKPLVDAYREKYGEEPPKGDDADERWDQLRADVMTGFMREVRSALNEIGEKRGRPVELSASMEFRNNLEQGLDVERWVKEGLVDNISPGVHGLGGKYFPIEKFAKMVKGTKCKLFARLEHTIKGHDPTPESERGEVTFEREHMTLNRYRARALEVYAEGGDGIYLFNTGGVSFIDALSDINGLKAWEVFEEPLVGWFDDVASDMK